MLRVGAHAAWAVPAIQVAVATPAFASSVDARLTAVVTATQQSGTTITITVQVTSTNAAASGVGLSVSGDITGTPTVTQTSGSTTLAVNGIATYTVTAKVKGTSTGASAGAVVLTPSGTTADSTRSALATPATAYARAQLAVTVVGYNRIVGDPGDYVVVKVSSTVVGARDVVVRLSGFNGTTTVSSAAVAVPLGSSVLLTIPVAFSTGSHTVTAAASGVTDNGGGAQALTASATVAVSSTNPYSSVKAATLQIVNPVGDWENVGTRRRPSYAATLSFGIRSDVPANTVKWTVKDSAGTVLKEGTAANITTNNGTVAVPQTTISTSPGAFTITATAVTTSSSAPALPGTASVTIRS